MTEKQAHGWLSQSRFAPFLAVCDGDHEAAVELYERHARVGAAAFSLIHHFEVLVRNAIDDVLGFEQPQAPISRTWLLDFETLRPDGVKRVITAIQRLEKGKPVTRGGIVAAVPFSFWSDLLGRRYEELWRQRLQLAFPHAVLTRKDIGRRMRLIQAFRNRVAHHDSLLGQDVAARFHDMLTIAGWVDSAARVWLERWSADAIAGTTTERI